MIFHITCSLKNESDYQIHSLSDELDSFKTDAEILKEKVSTQNEIIKSFISQMDSLKSFTLISNQNQNEIKVFKN
jgi:hypothetical protein